LRKYDPYKCVLPYTQKISYCHRDRDRDRERLKNDELVLSEGFILYEIPLDFKLWINLIKRYCLKLKYLFIKYSCKCAVLTLNFEKLSSVRMSMKINMLGMDCLLSICDLSSTVENFTAHIFRIDPVTFKAIPDEYKRTMT
jgi:hypothetical protein